MIMADKTSGMNVQQLKFVALLTAGGMSRAEAYMEAYGQKVKNVARRDAHQLIMTNSDVKAAIEDFKAGVLDSVRERFLSEAGDTVDKYFFLRDGGNSEYGIQFQVCKDHLDRIGLKPKEQVEHSGDVKITLLDIFTERRRRQEEGE